MFLRSDFYLVPLLLRVLIFHLVKTVYYPYGVKIYCLFRSIESEDFLTLFVYIPFSFAFHFFLEYLQKKSLDFLLLMTSL